MNIQVAADVGNSRIKWGVCANVGGEPTVVRQASLAADPVEWQNQLARWREELLLPETTGALTWAVAGVHPERCKRLCDWIVSRSGRVTRLDRCDQLPIEVGVDEPRGVGLDRLLNAVAAKQKLPPGKPAILVDAGTAVTVDCLDEQHIFRGGAIFPGFRLMAKALHDYTALLPEVQVGPAAPSLSGKSTIPAIQAGVFWAVVGGVRMIAGRLKQAAGRAPQLFLTGGDAERIVAALDENDPATGLADLPKMLWPEQTLQGVLLSALALSS